MYKMMIIKVSIKTHFTVVEAVGAAGRQGVHAAQFGSIQGAGWRTVTTHGATAVPA